MQEEAKRIKKKFSALRVMLWPLSPGELSPFKYIISRLCVGMVSETAFLVFLRQNNRSHPSIPVLQTLVFLIQGHPSRFSFGLLCG